MTSDSYHNFARFTATHMMTQNSLLETGGAVVGDKIKVADHLETVRQG